MAELLSTEDLAVFGGPAKIAIDLDFGPTGERGSKFFVNDGHPNSVEFITTPLVYDMYINLDPTGGDYRSLYQYQVVSGVKTWVKLTNLIPNTYSQNISTSFVSGETTINVPLISIVPEDLAGSIESSSFNVQHSIVNNPNPVASSMSINGIIDDAGIQVLSLTLKSVELSSGTWEDLSGQKTVHLSISVV